jgi:hypothetical protein
MISTFLSTLFGKLAIGAVGVALATGGMGATGNLPDPMQQGAADVLSTIGIEIPAPATEGPELPNQASERAGAALEAELSDEASPAAKAEQAKERQAPQLPDDASDKAKAVTTKVFEGDPAEGRAFGAGVAATAAEGASGASVSTPKAPPADGAGQAVDEAGDARDKAGDAGPPTNRKP